MTISKLKPPFKFDKRSGQVYDSENNHICLTFDEYGQMIAEALNGSSRLRKALEENKEMHEVFDKIRSVNCYGGMYGNYDDGKFWIFSKGEGVASGLTILEAFAELKSSSLAGEEG